MSNVYCSKRCPGNLVTGMSNENEPYVSYILTLAPGSSSDRFEIREICCIYSDTDFIVNVGSAENMQYSATYDDYLLEK